MEFLQNGWVVGIGGGIISGFVVYAVTALVFSKQSKREFDRRIAIANQEVVLAVRQGVPEHRVPEENVLHAMIAATARKHGLQCTDMYGSSEVAQDLIKDVMDSSFISAETKESYATRLSALIRDPADVREETLYRARSDGPLPTTVMSVGFAIITAASTLMVVLIEQRSGEQAPTDLLRVGFWVPVAAALLATSAAMATAYVLTLQSRRRAMKSQIDFIAAFEKGLADSPTKPVRSS